MTNYLIALMMGAIAMWVCSAYEELFFGGDGAMVLAFAALVTALKGQLDD